MVIDRSSGHIDTATTSLVRKAAMTPPTTIRIASNARSDTLELAAFLASQP